MGNGTPSKHSPKPDPGSLPGNTRDLALIKQYKESGNNRYVGELFTLYQNLILGTCIKYLKDREEGKDACMDIFESLLGKLQNHEVTNFKSWLYSLCRNHCLMKLRKMKGIIEEEYLPEKIDESFMETPDYEHLASEAQSESERLKAALGKLKEHQRVCVQLFYLEELSYREVADKTGFEMKKVKSYIQNGKRNLQQFLSQA